MFLLCQSPSSPVGSLDFIWYDIGDQSTSLLYGGHFSLFGHPPPSYKLSDSLLCCLPLCVALVRVSGPLLLPDPSSTKSGSASVQPHDLGLARWTLPL